MLATPRVGATVILSFIHGMREEPIVLGILPGAADINSIAGVGTADEIYPNTPLAYSNLA